jgi:gliding motility-associated-like protein
MRLFLYCCILLFCGSLGAQQFQNPDLEGVVELDSLSVLPDHWERIPATYAHCRATILGVTDTPDLTNQVGPLPAIGLFGIPYSGNSFMSGGLGLNLNTGNIWHEGIYQTVSGFSIDSFYTLSFYQSVVKQTRTLDSSGRWSVYLDDQQFFTSDVTYSSIEYYDPNLQWDYRTRNFRATDTVHTFYFLPSDNDQDFSVGPYLDGAIRMAIDSIYLRPTCYLNTELGNTRFLCEEDSVTLNILTTNGSYLWEDGGTEPSITVGEGHYAVTITGENGCIAYDEVSVIRNAALSLDLGPDTTLCEGATVTLNAATSGAFYTWQDGSSNIQYQADESGLYWVEVSVGGCIKRDSIVVSNNPISGLDLGADIALCGENSVNFSPTPLLNEATYSWQDGSDDVLYTTSETGLYWVEGMLDGCMARDSIIVYDAFPDFSLGADTVICTGESLLLDATLPNTTYLWQDGSTSPTFLATSGGIYTVALSRGNCTISDTLEITALSFGALDLGADTTLCPGASLTLAAEIPGANYVWQDQSTAADFTLSTPGLYWVTASLGDCAATDSILVSPHPLSPVDLGEEQAICAGSTLVLNAAQNGASYSWQDGNSASTYEVLNAGSYAVTVSLGACSSSDAVQVVNSLLQPFDLGPDLTLCQGESFTLSGPPEAESYNWSNGANTESITVSAVGTYRLIATLGECTEEDEFVLNYNPLAPFSLGADTTLCLGDSLQLVAANTMAEILWSDGTTENALWVDTPGNYGLTLTLDDCTENSSLQVDYYEATSLELGEDITICKTQPLVLAPEITGPPATFLWQDGTSTPSYDVQNSGTYSLILTNICETVTDEINITVEECTCEVYLPNAFSPNNDGNNDTFRPYTTCPITDYEVQIFDRWGGLRFTSNSIENGWQGLEVNTGVYLYTLRYRDRDGQWQQRVGEVSLIR